MLGLPAGALAEDPAVASGTDITGLAAHWRGTAKFHTIEAAKVLRQCADEVEQAWHDHAHDGEWRRGCKICWNEMTSERGEKETLSVLGERP